MERPPNRTVVTQCECDSADCQSVLGRASISAPLRGTTFAKRKDAMLKNQLIIKDTHRALWYEDGVLVKVLEPNPL
jgi:hypothetical protein